MSQFVCRYDAVLFDMDNTLHNLYDARFCAAEAVTAWMDGFSDSTFGNLLFYTLNRDTPTLIPEAITQYLEDIGETQAFSACLWLYEQLETSCIQPYTKLVELVHRLKAAGVKVAVISNADSGTTAQRIADLGLSGMFDTITNPETFGVKKPDVRVYQKTLEVLGVAASRAVMIGDKLDRDVLPARAAGLSAIHVWFGSLDLGGDAMMAHEQTDVEAFLRMDPAHS